jgi:AraC-like DNA-binding protein
LIDNNPWDVIQLNPIRKQFVTDFLFPFDMAYNNTKSLQNELPEHFHEWFELIYVYHGKGTLFIDSTFYDMEAGDWFIIPGNTIHRAFPNQQNPVTSTALFFSPILVQQASLGEAFTYQHCFERAKKYKVYKIRPMESSLRILVSCLDEIQQEAELRKPGNRHAILLHLHHIMLLLSREILHFQHKEVSESTSSPLWIRDILNHIDQYPEADLSLRALASRASVTASHLSRVFKSQTGMTVTEFVNTKRMIRAGELLLTTDNNIVTIASMCGMESLPHFHRTFKKITGWTPAGYKRQKVINPQ